jgi:hypothetical protein
MSSASSSPRPLLLAITPDQGIAYVLAQTLDRARVTLSFTSEAS